MEVNDDVSGRHLACLKKKKIDDKNQHGLMSLHHALVKVLDIRDSIVRDLECGKSVVDAQKQIIVDLENKLSAARKILSDTEKENELCRKRLKRLDAFK